MKLNELKYTKGSRRKEMRVGRGCGSKGKQCGRGMNGQSKHNGAGTRPGFEGGQLPLYRAIPKFGFTNFTRKEYAIVSVADLEERFENGAVITPVELIEAGLIKKTLCGVYFLALPPRFPKVYSCIIAIASAISLCFFVAVALVTLK